MLRLKFFKEDGSFKILCCGGDGTVGWLLEEMGKMTFLDVWMVSIEREDGLLGCVDGVCRKGVVNYGRIVYSSPTTIVFKSVSLVGSLLKHS